MPVRDLLSAASTQGAAPADPYFYDVSLLLNGDGTNGAQNNTFLDSSTNNFTITRNGNTTQGSFSPYGSNWSLGGCSSSSDYLQMGSNAGLQLGSGDFTVECWAYFTTVGTPSSGENVIMDVRPTSTTGAYFNFGLSNQTVYWDNGVFLATSTVSLNTWLHIAIVRNSGSTAIYINGSRATTPTADSTNYTCGSTNRIANLSYFSSGNRQFNGSISNLRIVKGTAVYTGTSFTVPTAPLTAISGTSLLTLQSNRWIDNSSNAIPISVNGSPSVQRFSPFNPTAPYSTSVIGGSGYFDGSGAYLTIANGSNIQLGSSNFTLEGWIYPTTVSGVGQFFTLNGSTGGYYACVLQVVNGQLGTAISKSGSGWDQTPAYGTLIANAWQHVAVSRSGTNFYYYINGVQVGTFSLSGALYGGTLNLIGAYTNGTFGYYAGYLCDSKFTIGSALYTGSTYTVPTAPATTGTNTQFLESYTNAGILDLAMQNDLQTVGNAQVSTSVKKYGTGSLSFNGSGSYLQAPSNPIYNFGGDYTIEAWVYFNSTITSAQTIVSNYTGSAGAASGFALYPKSVSGTLAFRYFINNGEQIVGTTAPTTGTWYHIAVCRSGSSTKMFVNGTQEGSTYTNSSSYTSTATLKAGSTDGASEFLNGYIDDLRITNGLARYTANFTPPTSALPTY